MDFTHQSPGLYPLVAIWHLVNTRQSTRALSMGHGVLSQSAKRQICK